MALRVSSLAMQIRITPLSPVQHKFIHDLASVKFCSFVSSHSLTCTLCINNTSVTAFFFFSFTACSSFSPGFRLCWPLCLEAYSSLPTFCQFQFQFILTCLCRANLVHTLILTPMRDDDSNTCPVITCAFFY